MEQVREITECCICTDTYTDPRILSCIHTFCLKCLQETAEKRKSKPGDKVPCPLCRKAFAIPHLGMAGLQKNFFINRLVDIVKLSNRHTDVIICDVCKTIAEEEPKEIPPAAQYCIQCQQNICKKCLPDHKKYKDLQSHLLIPIGSPLKDELIKKACLQFCHLHSKDEVRLYCVDCNEVICMMCFAQKHKSHNCSGIDEAAEKLHKQIKCDVEKASSYAGEASAKIRQIETLQVDLQKEAERVEKEIIQRGKELKELVDKCTKSLLDELASVRQRLSKENQTKREESETHKIAIQSFETYCMELSNKGSSVEICRAANNLHLRAEELQMEHQKRIKHLISSTEVTFEALNLDELLKEENVLGNIQVKRVPTVQPIGTLSCLNSYGVTKLDNKIYVLRRYPNSILACDDEIPFKSQMDIKVDEFGEPEDIGSCKKSKCLYVTDNGERCIWKIETDDHRVTKWLTGMDDAPFNLSVTNEGHVLILRVGEPSYRLEIYGADAKLIRRLSLPSGIRDPQQIQKQNGEFIISHLAYNSGRLVQYVISRLTSDGQTFRCGTNTKDLAVLFEPEKIYHFALDSDSDRIFVTNYRQSCVFLISSTSLNLMKVLLTKEAHGITSPWRLFYDEKKKQLIVAQWNEKTYIYAVS